MAKTYNNTTLAEHLKLGITQEEFLADTKGHLAKLYEDTEANAGNIAALEEELAVLEAVAQGKVKTVTYDTIDAMISGLFSHTSSTAGKLAVGDVVLIVATDVPDFWIRINSNTKGSTAPTASAFAAANYTNFQIGIYTVCKLETQKIDISKMVESTSTIPADEIVLGSGNRKIKTSGKKIETSLTDDDAKIPTSKAVKKYADDIGSGKVDKVEGKGLSENDYTTAEKTKLSQIDNSLLGVTADQIGKVKDVTVNGASVLNTGTGVAAITIEALKSGYLAIATTDSCWTTQTVNGTTYQAIKVERTNTAIEVYNASKQKIVTQNVFDDNYLYLCVGTEKIACTLRTFSGNGVGEGSGGYGWGAANYEWFLYAEADYVAESFFPSERVVEFLIVPPNSLKRFTAIIDFAVFYPLTSVVEVGCGSTYDSNLKELAVAALSISDYHTGNEPSGNYKVTAHIKTINLDDKTGEYDGCNLYARIIK